MTESFFQFHSPHFLLLLIAVLPLFIFDLRKLHLFRFKLGSVKIVEGAVKTWRARFEFLMPLLRAIGLCCLIVALARPQIGNKHTEVDSEGVDIVLTLDTSGSMQALDLKLNGQEVDRLAVVKSVVADFIKGRQFDRIGMVVFGTEAYTQCPLTLDYDILLNYLDMIEIGIAGEETAIGNALATAVKRLQASEAKSKVIILLTDGANTAGAVSPNKAAEIAKENGIKVYTIAVGTKGSAPFPVKSFFGTRKVMMPLDIDVETLSQIAKMTNGEFFQANDTEALKKIYQRIDELEKTEVKVKEFNEYEENFLEWLVPGFVLILVSWFLQNTVFLRVP